MTYRSIAFGLLGCFALMVSGCGGSEPASTEVPANSTNAATSSPAPADSNVKSKSKGKGGNKVSADADVDPRDRRKKSD